MSTWESASGLPQDIYPSPPMSRSASSSSRGQDHSTDGTSGTASTNSCRTSPCSSTSPQMSETMQPDLKQAHMYAPPPSGFCITPYNPEQASASAVLASRQAVTSTGPSSASKPLVSCVPCKKAHLKCQPKRPCDRCVRTGKEYECVDTKHKDRGRPPKDPEKIKARAAARLAQESAEAGLIAARMRSPHAPRADAFLSFFPSTGVNVSHPHQHHHSPSETSRPGASVGSYGVSPTLFPQSTPQGYGHFHVQGHDPGVAYSRALPAPVHYLAPPEFQPPAHFHVPPNPPLRQRDGIAEFPPQPTMHGLDVGHRPPRLAAIEPTQLVDPSSTLRGLNLSRSIRPPTSALLSPAEKDSLQLPPLRFADTHPQPVHPDPIFHAGQPSQHHTQPPHHRPGLPRLHTAPPPYHQPPPPYPQQFHLLGPPPPPSHPHYHPMEPPITLTTVPHQPRRFSDQPGAGVFHSHHDYPVGVLPRPVPLPAPVQFTLPFQHHHHHDSESPTSTGGVIRKSSSESSLSYPDSAVGDSSWDRMEAEGKKRRKIDLSDIVC